MTTPEAIMISRIFEELDSETNLKMSTEALVEMTAKVAVERGIVTECDTGDVAEALDRAPDQSLSWRMGFNE